MRPTIYVILITAYFLSMQDLHAQIDSSETGQGIQLLEDKYDESYNNYVKEAIPEIRKLWKINFVDMYVPVLSLGIEYKLSKTFTSESSIKIGLPYRSGLYSPDIKWSLSHSFKYYYNLQRREKLGRKTNGFQANYFSFDIFAGEDRDPKPGYDNLILKDAGSSYGISMRFGMQKYFRSFYIEPYIGLGYQYYWLKETKNIAAFTFPKSGGWHLQPILGLSSGIAIESLFRFQNISTVDHFFDSDSNRKYQVVWKTNLVDLRLLKPNVGLEWRIAGNLTSETFIKLGLDLKPTEFKGNGGGFGAEELGEIEMDHQLKYYLNFKRRFTHGKNTEGFSGNYFSLGLFAGKTYYQYDFLFDQSAYPIRKQLDLFHYGLRIKYGIQRQIGQIGFVDVFAGLALQKLEVPGETINNRINKHSTEKILPVIGIRAGFGIGSGTKKNY